MWKISFVILIASVASCAKGYYNLPQKKTGCHPPQFKDGTYSPDLPQGICPVETVLHFKCKPGYYLTGPKIAKCTYNGFWSPSHIPVCRKYCPSPIAPLHGVYSPHYQHYMPGKSCHFKCKPGYYYKGHAYAKCMSGGYWSHSTPGKCYDINECTHFPSPCGLNAACVNTEGSFHCICNQGYLRKNGKCFPQVCKVPNLTGRCSYSPTYRKEWDAGQTIHFHCPTGYELIGHKSATCMTGGRWNFETPICKKKVYCHVPLLPNYCGYSPQYQKSWVVGGKIHFHCPAGFKLIGMTYAICSADGMWGSHPPKCERPKLCDLPHLPASTGYAPQHKKHWKIGEQITFFCPSEFKMIGHARALCIDHGTWSNNPPTCKKPTMCPLPVTTLHCGHKPSYNTWRVGQKITFFCPDDYTMVGESQSTCQGDGTWSSEPPTCTQPTTCPPVSGNVMHGSSYKKAWAVGEKIFFKCPQGYDLLGNTEAVCQDNGQWSAGPPTCTKHPVCYLPKIPAYCEYGPYQKSWNVGEKIFFHCPSGYQRKGHQSAVCQENGHWDNHPPTCYRLTCYAPHLPMHCGYTPMHQKTWYVGHKIHFNCPHGYQMQGHAYAVCKVDGKWDHDAPICYKPERCYAPHTSQYVSYGDRYDGTFPVGHVLKFVCPTGFYLKGNDYSKCIAGGMWDKSTPHCIRSVCPAPHLPAHCSYYPKYRTTWHVGHKIKFYCPGGYEMKGHKYATCSYDGKWDSPAPTCYKKPVYCKVPALPPNCQMSSSYKEYYAAGEITRFVCPSGYYLKGYESSKCLHSGYWSHPPPVCHMKYGGGYRY